METKKYNIEAIFRMHTDNTNMNKKEFTSMIAEMKLEFDAE